MGRVVIIGAVLAASTMGLVTAALARRDEDVTFGSGNITIACTLSLPADNGRFPAVVLLSSSGPQDRDSELGGFRPFKLIAELLVSRNIAVLRCDDQGVGGSSRTVAESTMRDCADDALAAVWMRGAGAEIDAARVGLAGHSEGAIVAAIAASTSTAVRFVVWMARSAVRGAEILSQQAAALPRASGSTKAAVTEILGHPGSFFWPLRRPGPSPSWWRWVGSSSPRCWGRCQDRIARRWLP